MYSHLVLLCGVSVRAVLRSHKYDGRAAWDALVVKYEGKGSASRVELQRSLFSMGLGSRQDPDVYFAAIEETARQLGAMGHSVDEDVLAAMVVGQLPETYSVLRAILGDGDHDYDTVKEKVKVFYRAEIRGKQLPRSDGYFSLHRALMAGQGKKGGGGSGCWICHEMDHKSWECPIKLKDVICHTCGEKGHKEKTCTKGKKGTKGGKCEACKKMGHSKETCPMLRGVKHAVNMALEGTQDGTGMDEEQAEMMDCYLSMLRHYEH